MIVYAESNFIIELAYQQTEHEACEELIKFAECHVVKLVIPAISISEPYESLIRRQKRRNDLVRQLNIELSELSRSRPYAEVAEDSKAYIAPLVASIQVEQAGLDATLERCLNIAEIAPIKADTVRAALALRRDSGLESPQDALVAAALLEHMRGDPDRDRIFVNRNTKDFLNPDVQEQLGKESCKFFGKFTDSLGYLRNLLQREQ